ncbi:F-box only protein 6 isoform X1 [Neodiprion lecontei]|uniref:F-box only protein 6 isoform X1 n=2 Tax=Neodiprion lecontei TaxID=441921 RepID=A0A6J0C3E9_NEOLC|nr:F-box only protein 6 isoform X1 [Neodiprion lecontei]
MGDRGCCCQLLLRAGQLTFRDAKSSIMEWTSISALEARIEFNESANNGLVLTNKYLPEELLSEILFRVDLKAMLNCQLVCKCWYSILHTYVWRKKAEAILGQRLHFDGEFSWLLYYVICNNNPIGKNLLKNHSGRSGTNKFWRILSNGGHRWKVECPPAGAPKLPSSEPVFENEQFCFVTSFGHCNKEQTVDLVSEGFPPRFLDQFQPPIVISEWYSSRWDCPAAYKCSAVLKTECGLVLKTFHFENILDGETQNTWFQVQHEFTNYGPGVRKVTFTHGGIDQKFWAGHYGSKMAGACIKVNLPKQMPTESEEVTYMVVD